MHGNRSFSHPFGAVKKKGVDWHSALRDFSQSKELAAVAADFRKSRKHSILVRFHSLTNWVYETQSLRSLGNPTMRCRISLAHLTIKCFGGLGNVAKDICVC